MYIRRIEDARRTLDRAEAALRAAVASAVTNGGNVSQIARAARITRPTVYRWSQGEKEGEDDASRL